MAKVTLFAESFVSSLYGSQKGKTYFTGLIKCTIRQLFNEFNTKQIQNYIIREKTKSIDGSGFCPNAPVTSVETLYYVFPAEL